MADVFADALVLRGYALRGHQRHVTCMTDRAGLLERMADAQHRLSELEEGLQTSMAQNGELWSHIVENWASATSPGFFVKIFKIRQRKLGMRKLAEKCIRAILSVHSDFVMDVRTVRTWAKACESPLAPLSDEDISQLYEQVLALRHDPEFTAALTGQDPLFLAYFLDKVPFIRNQKDSLEGRHSEKAPLTYPRLEELIQRDQVQIRESLNKASRLGAAAPEPDSPSTDGGGE